MKPNHWFNPPAETQDWTGINVAADVKVLPVSFIIIMGSTFLNDGVYSMITAAERGSICSR